MIHRIKKMKHRMKTCLFKIMKLAGIGAAALIAAALMLALLFNATVNYTFRTNPPTAEELAEWPELARYADNK